MKKELKTLEQAKSDYKLAKRQVISSDENAYAMAHELIDALLAGYGKNIVWFDSPCDCQTLCECFGDGMIHDIIGVEVSTLKDSSNLLILKDKYYELVCVNEDGVRGHEDLDCVDLCDMDRILRFIEEGIKSGRDKYEGELPVKAEKEANAESELQARCERIKQEESLIREEANGEIRKVLSAWNATAMRFSCNLTVCVADYDGQEYIGGLESKEACGIKEDHGYYYVMVGGENGGESVNLEYLEIGSIVKLVNFLKEDLEKHIKAGINTEKLYRSDIEKRTKEAVKCAEQVARAIILKKGTPENEGEEALFLQLGIGIALSDGRKITANDIFVDRYGKAVIRGEYDDTLELMTVNLDSDRMPYLGGVDRIMEKVKEAYNS